MPTTIRSSVYGAISQRVGVHAEKKLLEHAEPILILNKLGQHRPIPRNTGEKIIFRRPERLSTTPKPLTEGVVPDATSFNYVDVEADLVEYGDWTELTNKITDLHEDNVGADMAMMLGEQAAEMIELVTWGSVIGGTNLHIDSGSARTDVTQPISLGGLRSCVRKLRAQRAKPMTSILAPSAMYATKPIEASYVAVGHTNLEADIRNLKGFVPVAEYGSRQPLCPEELGSVENVRFILSPVYEPIEDAGGAAGAMLSTSGTSADVYPMMIFAKNSFGVVPLKGSKAYGGAIKPKVVNPGTPSHSDPHGRTGSVAWNTWFTSKILNDQWLIRYEMAATAEPTAS